jgi:dihydrofolate synthase/folylpolyglutamate synthase
MSYQQTLDYLFGRLPMYQRQGLAAYKADIGNIIKACEKLENPHLNFKSVHIAGTNGKGSTAHMIASILQESGYTVGLYTSPHINDFRERIKINGQMIQKTEVISFVSNNKAFFETLELSFFEFTVALAFNYFAKQKVDITIIKTGLGGRLDSTNIIRPELAIITNISLDHTNFLGDTIEKIAKEKAGIIKENTPIIIGRKQTETKDIFKKVATEKNAPLYYAEGSTNFTTDLQGKYQAENSCTALAVIKQLQKIGWNISSNNIKDGLNKVVVNTEILGRWQVLSENPLTICDSGHNEDGVRQIVSQIKQTPHQNLHFVFGTVNDKSISNILTLLPKQATYYFCKADIPRAMDANLLEKKAKAYSLNGQTYSSVNEAFSAAKRHANNDDLIFIGGSTFVVAEVL